MSQDLQTVDGASASSDDTRIAEVPACENCATPLQGKFCYQCGQSSHNPLRHVGHAIEEVFESFWHLDGRIFRTLRELWWPGRLANSYLAGHRAPYVAPLRLFVVISVITFFLAQFTISFGDEPSEGAPVVQVKRNAFDDAKTAADVIKDRDSAIQGLLDGKESIKGIPGASTGFDRSIEAMREQARARIAKLDPQHPELKIPLEQTGPQEPSPDVRRRPSPTIKVAGTTINPPAADDADTDGQAQTDRDTGRDSDRATDRPTAATPASSAGASDNPEKKSIAERWVEKKAKRAEANWDRFQKEPELLKHTIMSSIPTALFFMVPIFAIFLKLAYIETGRSYLEHLVVALYSHAWLCLAILAMFGLFGLNTWVTPHAEWFGYVIGFLEFVLWWWMPIYLLLMQRRVYRQAWWLTVIKYCVIGTVYLVLVSFGAAFVAINSFIS